MKKSNFIGLLLICLILVFLINTATRAFTNPEKVLDELEQTVNKISYPLVVFGGEPEGIMAAIAAARQGVETLLIMERDTPGGLMTFGGLNYLDINYGPGGKSLNRGLFSEWHHNIGGSISFSPEKATDVFTNMLHKEDNITIINNVKLLGIKRNKNFITELIIMCRDTIYQISANIVIDASQDSRLAVTTGVPYFLGGADIGLPERHMAVTLILHMANINWQRLKQDVSSKKYGPSFLNKDHAWGFVKIGQLYQPLDKDIKLRGLNIVLEQKGDQSEAYINSMLIFHTQPTDSNSLARAYQKGYKESENVLKFLRKNLAGFENAELLTPPPELYLREGRHVLADYQLQVNDLLNNKIFFDTISLASYPLDYQASTPEYNGFVLFNPLIYGIPLRSILAKNIDNLMVVGRSSGYSSLAAASARVLPTGMTTGEAAGIAAALSLKQGIQLRDITTDLQLINQIQTELNLKRTIDYYRNQQLPPVINDQEVLPYLEELISWGLVIAGYNNDFRLDETILGREFAHIIVKGLKRRQAPIFYEWVPGGLETMSEQKPLTLNQAAKLLLVAVSKRIKSLSEDEYYQKANELNLIPAYIQKNIHTNRILTRKEAYILIGHFLKQYSLPAELKEIRGEKDAGNI